jgi:Transposase DDE domain
MICSANHKEGKNMSEVKQVRNWGEYNKALERRGEIVLVMTEEYYEKLYYAEKQKKGGVRKYNPEMFELVASIQAALRMPIRSAIGFTRALLVRLFESSRGVANFGHASRMIARSKFKIRRYTKDISNIVLSFDSTGVSIHSTSGWHQRKHGGHGRLNANERWRKLHIAVDLETGQILACRLTDSNRNDCEVVDGIVDELKGKMNITKIIADGAYDTYRLYEIASELGAELLVPPDTKSKAQHELVNKREELDYLKPRDEVISFIRKFDNFEEGRKAWKRESGYHNRSKIEAAIFRLKQILGFNLRNKNHNSRLNEVITKLNILNEMLALGKAQYVA